MGGVEEELKKIKVHIRCVNVSLNYLIKLIEAL